jgi:hypothetical protein
MLHTGTTWGEVIVNEQPERREGERRSVMLDCRVDGVSSRKLLRLTDLSLSGGYVDTDVRFRRGDRIELTFALDGTPVTIAAVIMHARDGAGFGFRIDPARSSDEARRRIAEFLGEA